MSQFGPGQQSQNPYRPSGQSGYGNQPYGMKPGPYGPKKPGGPYQRPPRKSGLIWLWIVLGVGGFGLIGCCSCCRSTWKGTMVWIRLTEIRLTEIRSD